MSLARQLIFNKFGTVPVMNLMSWVKPGDERKASSRLSPCQSKQPLAGLSAKGNFMKPIKTTAHCPGCGAMLVASDDKQHVWCEDRCGFEVDTSEGAWETKKDKSR